MQMIEWYCADGHVVESHPDDGRDKFDAEGKPLQYRLPPMLRCIGPWDPTFGVWTHKCALPLTHRLVDPNRRPLDRYGGDAGT